MSPRNLWKVLALCAGLGLTGACQRSDEGDAPAARLAPVPRDQVAGHEPPEPRQVQRITAEGQLGPGRGTLIIDLRPPKDGTLTEGAPLRVSARGRDLTFPESIRTQLDPDQLPVRLPVVVSDGAADPAEVDLTYYWCSQGDSGSCHPVRVRLLVQLDLSGAGDGGEAHFAHRPES